LFGTWPPAIVVRLATPVRLGPTLPLAPATPGIVWQPPQPFCATICLPWSTSAGSGVGGPGLAGAGVGGALGVTEQPARPSASAASATLSWRRSSKALSAAHQKLGREGDDHGADERGDQIDAEQSEAGIVNAEQPEQHAADESAK